MSSVVISGTPITLICLVQEREEPFKVVIGRNNDVFDLKTIIMNEKPNDLATIDDDNLKLWKLDKPVPGEDIEELRKITFQNNENLKLLVATKDIADYWPEDHIPIRKHIHVIVELLGRKRTFDGSLLIDNSNAICNGLLQKFAIIPRKVCELQQLINAPLLRKLPVTSDEEKIYPELDRFVCTKDDERRSTIAKIISAALCSTIDREFSGNNSECMLHYPLDTMIRIPLKTFNRFLGSDLPIEIDRDDTDSGTMTDGTKRPDFLCWVNNLLILKGEEEASANNLYMARNELVEKFSVLNPVFFDKFQYMICYAAAGSSIGFYAIDGSEGAVQRLIALTNSLDANNHIDRITILRTVINIARIVLTISDDISSTIVPLGKRQKRGHSFITFYADSVEKRVLKADLPYSEDLNSRIQFLESMYQYAKGYPGLVQIEKGPVVTKKFYKIVMKTRGIPCLLITEDELREMAKCVLTGLARLHGGNFVHRDIKLPNILYIPDSCENFKYFLIYFVHGGFNKQKPGELLTGWDENTLTNAGCYTSTSDMYQFGKLLERYNNLMTTDDGKDFTNRLKSKCMTAAMALKHKWINNKVSTST
ncbi:29647_t:CDS:2 [Gigaspora margarita]|uniref:29647_t:CDS:1 n=1 Tax=Gigaspora margarita TaxID=4874 RepID=A0ABM8W4F5_GIGMA|nr:29647_t:CDS:2 [Gigaspora margarita]